jgi:SnoaL-like domain
MSKHLTISPTEAADRLAIRELVEAYPHCADRRDAKGQMALFTEDTHFVVYMDGKDPKADSGAARARIVGSGVCRPEQIRRDDALAGAEHDPHPVA